MIENHEVQQVDVSQPCLYFLCLKIAFKWVEYHVTDLKIICQRSGDHVSTVWRSYVNGLEIMYHWSVDHMSTVCRSYVNGLEIICLRSGDHM